MSKEYTHRWIGINCTKEEYQKLSTYPEIRSWDKSDVEKLLADIRGPSEEAPFGYSPIKVNQTGSQQKETPPALKVQEGGGHYKDMAIQPVEFIEANKLPFIEGCVIKYVSRHASKNGAEDIKKAIHFLELLLELRYKES